MVVAGLALAAPASAADTYASPTGTASENCDSPATACNIEKALNAITTAGDVVHLLGGSSAVYNPTTFISVGAGVTLAGTAGDRPLIDMTGTNAITAEGGTVKDVRIDSAATGVIGAVEVNSGGTFDRVSVQSSTITPCFAQPNATYRDTSCWYSGTSFRAALGVQRNVGTGTASPTNLQNVTAVSNAGVGLEIAIANPSGDFTVNASNVIADGVEDLAAARGSGAGTLTVNADHSNYSAPSIGTGVTLNETAIQSTPPVFLDAATGNFHQLASSAGTIDQGSATGIGAFDFDGQARSVGAGPDIGADEIRETAVPIIYTPVYAGSTSISGMEIDVPSTQVEVFVNGSPVGTTTATPGWTVGVPALIEGQSVTGRATAPVAATTSPLSAPVIVTLGPMASAPPPVVNSIPAPTRKKCKKPKKLNKRTGKCVKKKKKKK
ncbi:MAG: hypothetical protein QOD60_180 [Solirubrobacterales bacterium]|nr:hypothetical protein [Solirubrobacterales bacterium]